jgi:hypothetical protein
VFGSAEPQGGPWFWHRLDPGTGEGVKSAAVSIARVVVAADDPARSLQGAFLGLRKVHIGQGVVLHPIDADPPAGANEVPGWARIGLGAWWGAYDPLWAAWRERAQAGKILHVPDVGEIGFLAESDVVGMVLAAFDQPEVRWRAAGPAGTLEALADHARAGTGAPTRKASLAAAARQTGVSVDALKRLPTLPIDVREMDGYDDTWRGAPARVRGPSSP